MSYLKENKKNIFEQINYFNSKYDSKYCIIDIKFIESDNFILCKTIDVHRSIGLHYHVYCLMDDSNPNIMTSLKTILEFNKQNFPFFKILHYEVFNNLLFILTPQIKKQLDNNFNMQSLVYSTASLMLLAIEKKTFIKKLNIKDFYELENGNIMYYKINNLFHSTEHSGFHYANYYILQLELSYKNIFANDFIINRILEKHKNKEEIQALSNLK